MTITTRVSPASIPSLPTIGEKSGLAAQAAAPLAHSTSIPEAPSPKAAVFEGSHSPSLVEQSGNSALLGASVNVPAGAKPLLQMLLTRNHTCAGFSPQRAGEIGAAFEKADRAGSLDWNAGLPGALLGTFFAELELPRAQPDGNKYAAYVYVGPQKTDPNDAIEVYVTRVGARKDYARLSVGSDGESDTNRTQASPRRSPAEQLWKHLHGEYPDQSTTIMAKMNWPHFKIDFPE